MSASYSMGSIGRGHPDVVGGDIALDPGHDRDPQLYARGPAMPVEDVLRQQREEAFHGGVVACLADLARRTDQDVARQRARKLARGKLTAGIVVRNEPGQISHTPPWARVKKACSSASRTSGVLIDPAARQPMIRRA